MGLCLIAWISAKSKYPDTKLFISGGSDFHGNKKPNIDIGVGAGTLNISKKYIEEWI